MKRMVDVGNKSESHLRAKVKAKQYRTLRSILLLDLKDEEKRRRSGSKNQNLPFLRLRKIAGSRSNQWSTKNNPS